MPKPAQSPDRLFDRPWRWGHPFARRTGRARRWGMTFLLLLLCAIIYTYGHVTDATRVRLMAEGYLSRLVGGRVVVGRAYLSIFEGLRLDDVEVHVDPAGALPRGRGDTAPDSLLFSAKTFVIKYDPKAMLGGTLEATQIIVQKPRVHLTENLDDGEWNWYRVVKRRGGKPRTSLSPSPPPKLPEILLRNARIEFGEVRGGRLVPLAYLAVDGQLGPGDDGERYNFDLQSRGVSEMGPSVSGWVSLARGQVSAKLMNFSFGPDVRSMLPVDVRQWWERHDVSGRLDIPVLSYTPAREGRPQSFRVETVIVDGVALTVRAEEWMASQDVRRLNRGREALVMMRDLYRVAGFKARPSQTRPAAREAAGDAAGPRDADRAPAMIDVAAACLEPTPLKLENVAGKFVFTQDGVSIEGLSGRVDNNGLKINGRIEGYTPEAPVALRVTSFTTENLTIPASPRYISSLPGPVREFYEQLRPEGTGRLAVEINRATPGAQPEISGRLDIINGRFLYSRFPYPLREVTGRVVFGRDPASGTDRVEIQQVRGKGLENGPNRNSYITIDGKIGPIGPTTGVNVRVVGEDISSEETLRQAFPPEVRKALTIFDPGGKGVFPQYRGRFKCDIVRPVGVMTPWSFDTDITLDDASGKLEAFPYPLEHVRGDLKIRTGHVDIENATMQRGAAHLAINGRVSWGREAEALLRAQGQVPAPDVTTTASAAAPAQVVAAVPGNIVTDLKIAVRNAPVDADLLSALPPERRGWLEKVGIRGSIDIDGRIYQGVNARRTATAAERAKFTPLDYDLDVTIRDGTLWPAGGTFAVSGLDGKLLMSRQSLHVMELKGKRGNAELSGAGRVDWTGVPGSTPHVWLSANAKGLALDTPLYAALPDVARKAWDELQPQGTLDVEVGYDNALPEGLSRGEGATRSGATPPEQPFAVADAASLLSPVDVIDLSAPPPRPAPSLKGFKAVLKPRDLSVTLRSVPYRLDHLTGAVTVLPDKVVLQDVAAARGGATLSVSGTGVVGGRGLWDLKLAAENLPVDDELRHALPASLSDVLDSLKVTGKIGFDFPRFVYRGPEAPARDGGAPEPPAATRAAPATGKSATSPAGPGPDVNLAGTISLSGASLDVGVPLSEVQGKFTLTDVVVRDGRPVSAAGDIAAKSAVLAGRTLENFQCDLFKPAGRDELRFEKMRARMCGGVIGGGVTLNFPDDGPSRYALNLAVRNADVAALTSETEKGDVKGELTASLALEGSWGAAAVRRGRGDVSVVGRGMYRVPLVLGLLQVTNLALPISGPFNEATARYSVDGELISFQNMELRSDAMVMSGDGHLDFGTKQVRLSFVTDNPKGLKVPFLNDLLQGARQELLKIHVRGTIQEPKVSAGVMGTFTTTIDEVMKGDPPPTRPKKRK